MNPDFKKRLGVLLLLPIFFFPIHFLYSINISHSSLWITEHIPDSFFEKVRDDSIKEKKQFTIGGYAMRTLCWSYRNFREGGDLNHIQSSHYPEYLSDFQIVDDKYLNTFLPIYTIEDHDPISGLSLLKRNERVKTNLLYHFEKSSEGERSSEFFNLYRGDIDSLKGESLLINLQMKVLSDQIPLKAWLVVEVDMQNNEKVSYEFVALDWKKSSWKGSSINLNSSLFVFDLPPDSKIIKIYFWNPDKVAYILDDIQGDINKVISAKVKRTEA